MALSPSEQYSTTILSQKKIWSLAWPMILANVATTLIGIVDTAILGHLPDPAFIGGAAIATSLFNIIFMSLAFLRMGTTGLIAQHYGEKHWQNLYSTLTLSIVIALVIGISLIVFSNAIFQFSIPIIGGSNQVQTTARIYSEIRMLSAPFVLFNFVALGFLIGVQKSRYALALLMFSQVINIILDVYLAVYLNWEVEGIAWATVLSDISGSILAIWFIFIYLKPRISSWILFPQIHQKLSSIFLLNKNIFFRTIVLISIFAFITAQSARQGDVVLAANSILIQLFFFLANAIDGFANAAESRTGELIGENKRDFNPHLARDIQQGFTISMLQGCVFLSLALISLNFFSGDIIRLISNQPAIIETSETYFFWLPILMVCAIVCFILDGVLIGATQGRTMLVAIVISTVFVFFPSWYLLQSLANHGIWLALCLFMIFRSGLTYKLFLGFKRQLG